MLAWLAIILAFLAGLFYLLTGMDSSIAANGMDRWAMIGAGTLMSIYVIVLATDYGGRLSTALRDFGIWLALGLALVIGYSFRDDLALVANRVTTELAPPGHGVLISDETSSPVTVKIRRQAGDHFTARGVVNGTSVTFLVDTGASTVVLKPADAARIGIDTDNLSFTVAVQTANGTAYAAPVRLKSVAVGPINLSDVDALIAKPGNLNESLLGMSFLRRLRSYEFSGEFLTLRE